jgi:hypothetical protein
MKTTTNPLIATVLILLAASLAHFGCSSSSPTSSTHSRHFLFGSLHSVSDNPVVQELANVGTTVQEGTDGELDGLVIDGNKISAADLEVNNVIKDHLRREKAILLLNATAEHKAALRKHIGISFGADTSLGVFVLPVAGTYGRTLAIYDHPIAWMGSTSDMSTSDGLMSAEVDATAFQASQEEFRNEVETVNGPKTFSAAIVRALNNNADLREASITQALHNKANMNSADSGSPGSSSGLKQRTWKYNPTVSWKFDSAWPSFSEGYFAPWVYPAGTPTQGYQSGTITSETDITLYLDNAASNVNGPYQWLVVNHQGSTNPATDHSTFLKWADVLMPMNGLVDAYKSTPGTSLNIWGYAQMGYSFDVQPSVSNDNFSFYSADPPNTNSVTTYTSGYTFEVGVTDEGVDASVVIEHSKETEISDWEVVNNTNNATLDFNWEWHSASPSNTSKYSSMNTLNTLLFQPNASAVMQTNTLITDTVQFDITYGVTQISIDAKQPGLHPELTRFDVVKCMNSLPATIDFSSVLYPILQSLTVSPDQVQGGGMTSGTITLDSNAPAGGTIVTLTVPETVTILERNASASFTITTSTVTGNVVPTITASLNGTTVNDTMIVTP